MKNYFVEVISIWYWALFRPELLQSRFNELAHQTTEDKQQRDTPADRVILPKAGTIGFSIRYFVLICLFSSPLLFKLIVQPNKYDLFFLIVVMLCAYGASFIFLPFGSCVPPIVVTLYLVQAETIQSLLQEFWGTLP